MAEQVNNATWGTPERRREEADRILQMLTSEANLDEMSKKDEDFFERMTDDMFAPISPGQLTWLRDLRDRYL